MQEREKEKIMRERKEVDTDCRSHDSNGQIGKSMEEQNQYRKYRVYKSVVVSILLYGM